MVENTLRINKRFNLTQSYTFHNMKKKYTTPAYRLHRLRSQALLDASPFENRYYNDQADIKYSSDMVSADEAE